MIKTLFEIAGCTLIAVCFMRGFLAYAGKFLDWASYQCALKAGEPVDDLPEKTFNPFAAVIQIITCLSTVYWFRGKYGLLFVPFIVAVYLTIYGFLGYVGNFLDVAIYKLEKRALRKIREAESNGQPL